MIIIILWLICYARATNSMLRTIIRECISMATLINAHSTTILTNREPSELLKVHPYALQVGYGLYYKKNDHLKISFVVYGNQLNILPIQYLLVFTIK